MSKIGRNQPCFCGSGKKFKHCCRTVGERGQERVPEQNPQVILANAIDKIQQSAYRRKEDFFELGVFIFFSNSDGDAWLLEFTESDAMQLSRGGEPLEAPIEENSETIEANWSHTFKVEKKQLKLTAYGDKAKCILHNAPTQRIYAALRRMKKRFSPELIEQVHLPLPETLA
ncbi:MAG: preprotein translocase subunit SecA [Desulfobulbus propionicus]|nr:MAG: preprotein translocase subunit SecA [Desulfobulbus propionicus]